MRERAEEWLEFADVDLRAAEKPYNITALPLLRDSNTASITFI